MKTERKFIFTIILEDDEYDYFRHIWVEAVNLELLDLNDGSPRQRTLKEKHKEFHDKITKELI